MAGSLRDYVVGDGGIFLLCPPGFLTTLKNELMDECRQIHFYIHTLKHGHIEAAMHQLMEHQSMLSYRI